MPYLAAETGLGSLIDCPEVELTPWESETGVRVHFSANVVRFTYPMVGSERNPVRGQSAVIRLQGETITRSAQAWRGIEIRAHVHRGGRKVSLDSLLTAR